MVADDAGEGLLAAAAMPSGGASLTFDLALAIRRPRSVVFAFLADIQDAEPIPRRARVRMTKYPATTTEIGTRWDERVRVVPGWWLMVESVVTAIDEPSLLEMDFRSRWFRGHLAYLLEATPDGTVLRQRETLRLRRPLRWFSKAVERSLRTQLSRRLTDIATLLEA